MTDEAKGFACWGVALLCLPLAFQSCPVQADDVADQAAEKELALALAQACANEAGGHIPDCYLIWQTARGQGRTHAARLDWLRRHSSSLLGPVAPEDRPTLRELWAEHPDANPRRAQPPTGSNVWWTWHLTDSDAEPANYPGEWNERAQRRWRQTRILMKELVGGRPYPRPCSRTPQTWGGRSLPEAQPREGYVRLHCTSTRNEGFRYER